MLGHVGLCVETRTEAPLPICCFADSGSKIPLAQNGSACFADIGFIFAQREDTLTHAPSVDSQTSRLNHQLSLLPRKIMSNSHEKF